MALGNNIAQLRSYTDSNWYRATCGCMANNHDRTIVVTMDDDVISCTIYADLKYYDWSTSDDGFFSKAWSRIKGAWKILTSGYIEFQGEFMFDSADAARDYANAIKGAADELERKQAMPAVQANAGNG